MERSNLNFNGDYNNGKAFGVEDSQLMRSGILAALYQMAVKN